MQAVMETIFDVAYLVTVIAIGLRMLARSKGNRPMWLFGLMAVILGCGDAFHLIPRIHGLLTGSMEANSAMLGFGKLVTSITMTVFYVLLYHFGQMRYRAASRPLTAAVYTLAVIRIALCLFPQNDWFSASAPLRWGIYRNTPFMLLGACIVVLAYVMASRRNDKAFRHAWLAVLLSFAFYIPVVLWADAVPVVGMLMLPKTLCYVWLVLMGYRAQLADQAVADGKPE